VSDILIRGVPDSTVAEIDRRAADEGLSRAEYLPRQLDIVYRAQPEVTISTADWHRFRQATADLNDPDVMGKAWS
jgi:hypothetical protein